ncbi:hypothetical protein [Chitinivorax sp. B]|uniref:hypothetical protein n=1 Tax=Chitinivorax sp. B TaxID=2502235 RepID=UPI0010F7864E|nr:hypothetical protein [Chitinivorax sp. B]
MKPMLLRMRIWLSGLLWLTCLSMCHAATSPPETMLWVWERPTDLRWLSPDKAGVAYLRTIVLLSGEQAAVSQRRQPIHMPATLFKIPVVHVDIDNLHPPTLNDAQLVTLVTAVEKAAAASQGWVQLDFEARYSQRDFYLRLLQALQPLRLAAPQIRLSVTALASWCMQDAWLDAKLVDEIVPMLFRMHRDGPAIRDHLARQHQLPVAACNQSVGLLIGDPVTTPHNTRRRYWFNPGDWQATTRFEKENSK